VFRPTAFRNSAAIALAFCLALGGIVRHSGWSSCPVDPSQIEPSPGDPSQSDSSRDSKQRQPVHHHSSVTPASRSTRVRTPHLSGEPDLGFQFAGSQSHTTLQVSALLASRRLPFPRTCAVAPRSGRSPPLSACL
jgi:hypothetical protein